MSLTTPTTQNINDDIIAELEAKLGQTIPLLPKSFLRVIAKVLAALYIILYKYAGFVFLQMFVKTAFHGETEINGKTVNPLETLGSLFGVTAPVAATHAELLIDIVVTNQTGSLPAGSQLVSTDNGVTYITLAAVALSSATVQATIKAMSDQGGGGGGGVIGNLLVGATVSFVNPLANVAREATVNSIVVTAADGENTATYRQRVEDHVQNKPQGGALADYKEWGEEVAGIINVYPYTSDCPGQVDVYCEATVASSGSADGIPTAAQLQMVLDSIELDVSGIPTRRPANALANTFAITRTDFNISITGLVVDNSTQVKADVSTGLTEYLSSREPYISGLSILPRKDRVQRRDVGSIVNDIVAAAGGIFDTFTVEESATPIVIYTLGIGEKAKLSTLTWL